MSLVQCAKLSCSIFNFRRTTVILEQDGKEVKQLEHYDEWQDEFELKTVFKVRELHSQKNYTKNRFKRFYDLLFYHDSRCKTTNWGFKEKKTFCETVTIFVMYRSYPWVTAADLWL